MRTLVRVLLSFALIGIPLATPAEREHYPALPEKVKNAKTVFLENQSTYNEAFNHLYEPLSKWGRWKVIAERSKADLRLILTRTSPTGERRKFNPHWFLVLTDPNKDDALVYISADVAIGSEKGVAKLLVKKLKERIENAAE